MQTINTLEKKKNLQLTAQAYDLLFSYFKKMKNYQRAVEISDKLHQVNKSFFARKSNIALSHYLAKLEVNTKELENIALKKRERVNTRKSSFKTTTTLQYISPICCFYSDDIRIY
jgi:hypothetical protein